MISVCNWSWLPWISYAETKRSPDKPTIQDHFKIVQRIQRSVWEPLSGRSTSALDLAGTHQFVATALWIGMNSIVCRAQPWGRWAATPREKASGAGFLASADMSCETCRTSEFGLEMQGVADCEPKCQMWAALSFSTSFNFVHSMVNASSIPSIPGVVVGQVESGRIGSRPRTILREVWTAPDWFSARDKGLMTMPWLCHVYDQSNETRINFVKWQRLAEKVRGNEWKLTMFVWLGGDKKI